MLVLYQHIYLSQLKVYFKLHTFSEKNKTEYLLHA